MADIGKPIRRIRVEPERVSPVPEPAKEPERKQPTKRDKEKVGKP